MINFKKIICNKCGNSCAKPEPSEGLGFEDNYGLNNATFTTGYFSKLFEDLYKIKFSICEECLFDLFNTCKILPEAQEVDIHGNMRSEYKTLKLVKGKFQ